MVEIPGIQQKQSLSPAMDYARLRREGIRYVQQLCGRIWTDYNDHDPGVTILEQVCYALTAVGYKTNLDIRTLMFGNDPDPQEVRVTGIYEPHEVLLSSVVTVSDFRILLLDLLDATKVRNVWLRPVQGVAGLFDIYVRTLAPDPDEPLDKAEKKKKDDAAEQERQALVDAIRRLYIQHRSLGEDVRRVVLLKPQYIELCGDVEISDEASPEKLLAELYYEVSRYFNPPVIFSSWDSVSQEGLGYEDIFNVPSCERGFIRDLEDKEQRIFAVSGVTNVITQVKGVRSFSGFYVQKDGIRVSGKHITIDEGYVAEILLRAEQGGIVLYRNHSKVAYDSRLVLRYYREKLLPVKHVRPSSYRSKATTLPADRGVRFSKNEVEFYSSVQYTFPVVYGIGQYGLPAGLPDHSRPARLLAARQLQSYLLFFDQLLLNHQAQIRNLSDLFSIQHPKNTVSYFSRLPQPAEDGNYAEVPDVRKLLSAELTTARLQELMRDDFYVRKNALLNHQLARYADGFGHEHVHNFNRLMGIADERDIHKTLVSLKCDFLQEFITLSKDRNRGLYYLDRGQHAFPFKRKLCLLLNLRYDDGEFSLVDHLLNLQAAPQQSPGEEATQPADKVSFAIRRGPAARDRLVFFGSLSGSYYIDNGAVFFREGGEAQGVKLRQFDQHDAATAWIERMIRWFDDLVRQSSGFHVVEHVLLRPVLEKQYHLVLKLSSGAAMRSAVTDYKEAQQELLADIILLGCEEKYYIVQRTGKLNRVILEDAEGNALAYLDKQFSDTPSARQHIAEVWIPYFRKLDMDRHPIPPEAHFEQTAESRSVDGFNTPRISLVFPNWVPRFQDPEFRVWLQHCICQCMPAHIGIHLQWLNIDQMTKFERIYTNWRGQHAKVMAYAAAGQPSDAVLYSEDLRRERRGRRKRHDAMVLLDEVAEQMIQFLYTPK